MSEQIDIKDVIEDLVTAQGEEIEALGAIVYKYQELIKSRHIDVSQCPEEHRLEMENLCLKADDAVDKTMSIIEKIIALEVASR